MVLTLSILIGFVSAFLGSLVGLGGGTILVPSLLILHQFSGSFQWVTPQTSVAISLLVMVFTALSSSISYFKSDRIDIKSGVVFLIGCIPGGVVGAYLNQFVQTDVFSIYFGIFMLLMFCTFFIKQKPKKDDKPKKWSLARKIEIEDSSYEYRLPIVSGLSISFAVGILSGLFGIGGGSLIVPAMILLFGFPVHIATATSMFMIIFLSASSTVTHIALGHIPWEYVWAFIPGAWLGGAAGARANQRMKGSTLQWILRVILVVIGIRLIWQGLG